MSLARKKILASPHDLALNSIHGVAFHRGLGVPLYPVSTYPMKYLDAPGIADFSDAAYARSNVAVVANGASHSDLSKWVKEFYGETGTGSANIKLQSTPSKYHGGEERIAHASGNVMILAFPGSPSFTSGSGYKPELAVLAALLGGESSIKWSPGFSLLSRTVDTASQTHSVAHISTGQHSYSDAGLLTVTISGKGADVNFASKVVVDTIKKVASGDVSQEDLKKATMLAKFRALEAGQQTDAGIEATGLGLIGGGKAHQIDEIAGQIEKVSGEKVKAVSEILLVSFRLAFDFAF
jgi:ubiquinol-cytochrome c reductase core subunit 2